MFTRKFGITMTVIAAAAMLSACNGFKSHSEVEALNEAKAVGSPFTQGLANGYRDLANREQNAMFDYPDALHFARKGLAAAAGEVVLPEPVSDWNLKPEHVEELSAARGQLITALDAGARESNSQIAATAQVSFDCWIEQQEENWQKKDIGDCKSKFMEAMAALGNFTAAPPSDVMPPVTAAPGASGPMAPEAAKYLVFFDFDSSKVDQGGAAVLDSVSSEVGKQNISSVNVTGHADKSGGDKYNQRLSMKRANSVRDNLIKKGVAASMIRVDSRGESEPMVQTADGVREPANRRAEITFSK